MIRARWISGALAIGAMWDRALGHERSKHFERLGRGHGDRSIFDFGLGDDRHRSPIRLGLGNDRHRQPIGPFAWDTVSGRRRHARARANRSRRA